MQPISVSEINTQTDNVKNVFLMFCGISGSQAVILSFAAMPGS
jgi:hypothetical protein